MRIRLHFFTRVLCGFLLALGATSLLGCGKPTGTVSGTVTYKGQPVTLGQVELFAKGTGFAGTGKLDSSGNFTIDVPLGVGSYERVIPGWDSPDNPIPPAPKGKPTTTTVPKKAQEFNTSGLTVEVKSGTNTVTLELKD